MTTQPNETLDHIACRRAMLARVFRYLESLPDPHRNETEMKLARDTETKESESDQRRKEDE